jgi:outer membrane immunogenic protein
MNRLLLASAAMGGALILAGPVLAADLAARPSYKAPPPVAAPVQFTWTGCHIGAHIGGGWGNKQWEDLGGDDISDNTSYATNGFLGGGQIGCDYQWGGPVVFGIEGSFAGTSIKGSGVQPFESETAAVSSKIDWLATLTGRVGFAVDHALIYVKGGGAWVREKHTTREVTAGDELEIQSQTLTSNRSGWLFGAGIEYAFLPNWSAKLEYNFMDFGTKSFLFDQLSEDPVSIKQQLHTITFGVNYRFNSGLWGKAPVVARY